ncbi:MAG: hypothetical protein IJZ74_08865 [Clostridia bacterium]|nr:hypothetical protein [Clostridia bacterium]
MKLSSGTQITSVLKCPITIQQRLGGGGQGVVYKIMYNGEEKALKVYKPGALHDRPAFASNLQHNMEQGAPSPAFVWPLDVVDLPDGTLGYVMNLIPTDEFAELSEMFLPVSRGGKRFSSFKAAVDAMLNITTAFRILHNRGYSYQDLNDGNFFINPKNGQVLICDNDNVAPNGTHTGIMGTPRFMAPEIILGRGRVLPNTASDRFSLSVILFMMLTMAHPLEGKRFLAPLLTPEKQEILYGKEPIFVMDQQDVRNRPVPELQQNLLMIYPKLPGYVHQAFERAFSQEVLQNPGRRVTEAEWQELLIRLRNEFVTCAHCGGETCLGDAGAKKCEDCAKSLPIDMTIRASGCDYSIPAASGTRLFRRHLGVCNIDAGLDPVGTIKRSRTDPHRRFFVNTSGRSATLLNGGTPTGTLQPDDKAEIRPGMEIRFSGGQIRFE